MPTYGYKPVCINFPSPTNQKRPPRIQWKCLHKLRQKIDPPWNLKYSNLIHRSSGIPFMHFTNRILCQRPVPVSTFQPFFKLSAKLNQKGCLIPQPPLLLGNIRLCHLTKWNFLCFSDVPHKKSMMRHLILSSTAIGTSDKENQYIGIAERTALSKVRRPPNDRKRLHQEWILLSIFLKKPKPIRGMVTVSFDQVTQILKTKIKIPHRSRK